MESFMKFESIIKKACEEIVDENIEVLNKYDCSSVTVSYETTRSFKKALNKAFFKESAGFKLIKILVACALIMSLLYVTIIAIEPIKTKIFGYSIEDNGQSVNLSYDLDETKDYPKYFAEEIVPVLPKGWSMEMVGSGEKYTGFFEINTPDGKLIYYSQTTVTVETAFDKMKYDAESVILSNGIQATLFEFEDGFKTLRWEDDYIFAVESFSASKEELIIIANSIE